MIDMVLLIQLSWCYVWLSRKRLQNTLLYAGGIVTAGYAAWQVNGWLSTWLSAPSNPAFLWLENNLTSKAQAVTILSQFIPPQPVDTTVVQAHWIALHVARTLVFCTTTLAVFVTFVVVVYLRAAIWDSNPDKAEGARDHYVMTSLLAGTSSLYAAVMLLLVLSNVAWFQPFQGLAGMLNQSLAIHLYTEFIHFPLG